MNLFLQQVLLVALVATQLAYVESKEICYFTGPLLGKTSNDKPNKCGPNTAMRYADRLGFNVAIDKWKFRWFDTKKVKFNAKEFDLAEKACYPHDQCYRDIKYGRKPCNQASFDECNNAFYDNMDDLCKKLPKGCARSACRSMMRDALYGIVKEAESNYKSDYC